MALGMVQVGYKNSLYMYPAGWKTESDTEYADLLAELTTELELALKGGDEEPVPEEDWEDSEQTENHLERKKEWEDLLEQTEVVEAMLRQMMENGLGQQKEQQKESSKKQEEEEPDNDFDLLGIPATVEGRHKSRNEDVEYYGNSEFLQQNSGEGSEYFSPSAAGRQGRPLRMICLTCETECSQKKQWKIT